MLTDKEIKLIEKAVEITQEAQQIIKDKDIAQHEYFKIKEEQQKEHFKILACLFGIFIICATVMWCIEIKESYDYSQEIDIENISESKSEVIGGGKDGSKKD